MLKKFIHFIGWWLCRSHAATLPEWLDQPPSHSARVVPATQPLWLEEPLSRSATLPRSGWVAEWLSGWRWQSGWVAEWLGWKFPPLRVQSEIRLRLTGRFCYVLQYDWVSETLLLGFLCIYFLFACAQSGCLRACGDSTRLTGTGTWSCRDPLRGFGSQPDLLTKTILRENLQVNVAPQIDPETATHTSCEPAQPKCIWTCHKSHLTREFTGKTRPRHTPQVFFRAFAIEMYMDMWDEELFCAWICKIL